jgi:glutathione-regulated potassium-efflux system ancillary protein KefC
MPGFEDIEHQVQNQNTPVILAGYGRIGQVIGRFLHSQGIGLTILEKDPGQIQTLKRFGWKVFYGDVSRLDLLRAAGAEQARLLILAIDDMDATTRTIELVKEHFKNLKILVRAETRLDAYNFINLNVPVVRATFAPGLEMGEEALKLLDFPAFETRSIAQRFKRYDRSELFKSAQHSEDLQTLITLSAQSREELTRIMTTDDKKRREIAGDSWD